MVNVGLHSWQDLSKAIILTIKMSILKAFPARSVLRQRQLTKSPLSFHTDEDIWTSGIIQNKLVVVKLNKPLGQKVKNSQLP